MKNEKTRKKIIEEMRADQARYDETTRILTERIERGLREAQKRRVSS